jgi:hypothetical protein
VDEHLATAVDARVWGKMSDDARARVVRVSWIR